MALPLNFCLCLTELKLFLGISHAGTAADRPGHASRPRYPHAIGGPCGRHLDRGAVSQPRPFGGCRGRAGRHWRPFCFPSRAQGKNETAESMSAIIGWDLRPAKTSFPRSPLIARPHGLKRAPVPVTPFRIGATGGKPARRAPCRRSRGHRPLPPQAPRFLDEKIKWRPSSSPTPKSVTPPFASPGSGGPRRAVAVPLGPRVYLQSFNHHRTACATAN